MDDIMDVIISLLREHRALLCYSALAILAYACSVIFYRLRLSPLAKFPGPKLAAATRLYEGYFQIIKGGTFTWHIDRLHEQYGPVVRVTPWEIHIKDPDYYGTVYAGPGRHRNRDPWFCYISYPQSLFSTAFHDLHRPRRRVLGEFFKKHSVYKLEPLFQANLQLLCKHFSASKKSNKALELHAAFYSFTVDVMSQYAFGRSNGFHYLSEQEMPNTWKTNLTGMFNFCRLNRHVPILSRVARLFPTLATLLVPPYSCVTGLQNDVRNCIRKTVAAHEQRQSEKSGGFSSAEPAIELIPNSIYPTILADPTVPASENELKRLEDDAVFLMMAGTDAPGQVLAITVFHILNNPVVLDRLKRELFSAIPEPTATPDLAQLEKLPYLGNVIREGLRLSSVVTTRLPREAPDEHLQYREWHIPAGTLVSMSTYFILRDPNIFPHPTEFLPDRWDLCPEQLQKLEKYLIPGSKGTLGCLGQNVAWAFMYHALSVVFRRFDMALHETTRENVEMTRDNFIGQTDAGMNNVQVKVIEEYSY